MSPEENIARFRDVYDSLRSEIGKVIVGQEAIVDGTLNALFANGHVLLEGVPGPVSYTHLTLPTNREV